MKISKTKQKKSIPRPACDVYLLFGHDEETGGQNGAAVMAAELKKRGVRFA